MNKLKIYLGDLTYDTVSLSTEAFPLNIGLIASYCKSIFGDSVDIKLFKYIDKLEDAINDSPPDVLGLSNYIWCERIDAEFFRMLSKQNPNSIRVWGGPNFPLDPPSQKKILDHYPAVDIYVPTEGELGFVNIVEQALTAKSKEELRNTVLSKPIKNCISRNLNGEYEYGDLISSRFTSLNEIPSPYITGLLDEFFDGKLSPMLQTNRGCPFTCTFCTDGTDLVKKITSFPLDYVKNDLEYIAKHVPKKTDSLFISDLNFGMYPRDQEVCNYIGEIQKKYGYPKEIQATTGKNQKEKIIENIKNVSGLKLCMSVQSMDPEVLANVKRSNISTEHVLALGPAIKSVGLRTQSEVILGLPGDTVEKHRETVRQLLRGKMDNVLVFTCMLLQGSELATPQEIQKWGFVTKFRPLTRNFTKLKNGKNIIESEEVIIAQNSMSFDEYVEMRRLSFMLFATSMTGAYDPIFHFMRQQNIDVFNLYQKMLDEFENTPKEIRTVIDSFDKTTVNELWDSHEEIALHYQDDVEYQKLLDGDAGINNIQFHNSIFISEYSNIWTEYVIKCALDVLTEQENKMDEEWKKSFHDVTNFCRGLSYNLLEIENTKNNPTFDFNYDVAQWFNDPDSVPISQYILNKSQKISFIITPEQGKIISDKRDIFGDTKDGRGQIIKRLPLTMLSRFPIIEESRVTIKI